MPSLAAEASAWMARRNPARLERAGRLIIERRAIGAKPSPVAVYDAHKPVAAYVPALGPVAADLARILSEPRAFPRALI